MSFEQIDANGGTNDGFLDNLKSFQVVAADVDTILGLQENGLVVAQPHLDALRHDVRGALAMVNEMIEESQAVEVPYDRPRH